MEILGGFGSIVDFFDFVMVQGHLTLSYVIREVGVRFGDKISTVLRDPVMSAISMANYVASRLMADPVGNYPDTRQWLEQLGMDSLPEDRSDASLRALAFAALQDDRIAYVNPICHYLGDGTSASAIDNIVLNNLELTDTLRYNRWLETRWNIPSGSRINQSLPILNRDDVVSRLSDRLHYLCSEDIKVFETVTSLLDARDTVSVKGHELA
jgi:hypothetical protein